MSLLFPAARKKTRFGVLDEEAGARGEGVNGGLSVCMWCCLKPRRRQKAQGNNGGGVSCVYPSRISRSRTCVVDMMTGTGLEGHDPTTPNMTSSYSLSSGGGCHWSKFRGLQTEKERRKKLHLESYWRRSSLAKLVFVSYEEENDDDVNCERQRRARGGRLLKAEAGGGWRE